MTLVPATAAHQQVDVVCASQHLSQLLSGRLRAALEAADATVRLEYVVRIQELTERVDLLLQANNREVERRRAAEGGLCGCGRRLMVTMHCCVCDKDRW